MKSSMRSQKFFHLTVLLVLVFLAGIQIISNEPIDKYAVWRFLHDAADGKFVKEFK